MFSPKPKDSAITHTCNSLQKCRTYLSHTDRSGSRSPSFALRRDTSPSPDQYTLPSFVEEAKKKKKGPLICHTERYRTHSSNRFELGPGSYSPKPIEKAPSISIGHGKARNFLKTSHVLISDPGLGESCQLLRLKIQHNRYQQSFQKLLVQEPGSLCFSQSS